MHRAMELRSTAFKQGDAIPRRHTCDGEDLSPPLEWNDVPAGVRSLALFCDDPDAPGGTWHHWAVYDIPPDSTGLPEGVGRQKEKAGFRLAINDFRQSGYGGPCPPRGHGGHHYHFKLLALSTDRLILSGQGTCAEVAREARKHLLAEASLIGVYERSA
jgi:Raf kinase inhibitor-like YbhB/YbcL family protein